MPRREKPRTPSWGRSWEGVIDWEQGRCRICGVTVDPVTQGPHLDWHRALYDAIALAVPNEHRPGEISLAEHISKVRFP